MGESREQPGRKFIGTASVLRPLFYSVLAALSGAHPGLILLEQLQQDEEAPTNAGGISLGTIISEAESHEKLDLKRKDIVLLVNHEIVDEFYGGSKEKMLFYATNKKFSNEAKSFEIKIFSTPEEFVRLINNVRNTDILIIESHGHTDQTGKPGSFLVGDRTVEDLLTDIKENPVRPNGAMILSVCSGADCKAPMYTQDETWVKLANKKLHPDAGKAYGPTALLYVPSGLTPSQRWAYLLVGQPVLGPMVFAIGKSGRRFPQETDKYFYAEGFRVYDRRTKDVRYYKLEDNKTTVIKARTSTK